MRRIALIAVLSLSAVLSGCTTKSTTGGPCTGNADCTTPLLCATNFTGGYCSRDCTTDTSVCAAGSACVGIGQNATSAECYATCATPNVQSTCRTGYTCAPVTGLAGVAGICLPN